MNMEPYQRPFPRANYFTYRATIAQVVGVPDPIGFNITFDRGTYWEPQLIAVGPDNYGANRTITVQIVDSQVSSAPIKLLMKGAVDDELLSGPGTMVLVDDTAIAVGALGLPSINPVFGPTDRLQVSAAGLINTEILTITLRLWTTGRRPTIVSFGAGLAAITIIYNRME